MVRSPRRRLLPILALLTAMFVATGPSLAVATDTVAFTITDARIGESSGLVRDTAAKVYWTVNDSGAAGIIYALTDRGEVRGTLNYRAEPVDAEAVAMYGDRLYVADIGDNAAVRDFVTVFLFPQPRPTGLTVEYRSFDFSYPDGQHDAEAFLVDNTGRFYIVTKGLRGGDIYAAPVDPSRYAMNPLERVGSAPAFVTDGVFLPKGDQIALRTYDSVVIIDATSFRTVAKTTIPVQPQGESIAVSLDGESLLLGSEGKNSKVYKIKIPTDATATATPSGSPSNANGSDPGAAGDEDDEESATAGAGRAGTLLALGLAAFVALVAGVVVGAVHRTPRPRDLATSLRAAIRQAQGGRRGGR